MVAILSTEVSPIVRLGLHEAVAGRLRRAIVEGSFKPGARLNERLLCESMGVSRTPMREAIKKLIGEGLLREEPNKGVMVPTMSVEEVSAAFEVIAVLEGLSGELAAKNASEEEISRVLEFQLEMEAAHAQQNLSRYYEMNSGIHSAINQAAGNMELVQTFSRLNAKLQSLRFRSNLNQQKWKIAVDEHAQIARALKQRDGLELSRLLRQHLLNKREIVIQFMREEGENPQA